MMDPLDREVAGLTCRGVLHALGDLLDGDLAPDAVARVQAHLSGCDNCARFGGHVGSLMEALRQTAWRDAIPPNAADRLRARLAAERS